MPIQGRIVINPKVLTDDRDALAVAYNEAYRAVMEAQGFEPKARPTREQEEFFADTAYANDPLMMRRTITARIATYDSSVPDPTPEQYQDVVDMLQMVMGAGVIRTPQEDEIVSSTLDDMEQKLQEAQNQEPEVLEPNDEEAGGEEQPYNIGQLSPSEEEPPQTDVGNLPQEIPMEGLEQAGQGQAGLEQAGLEQTSLAEEGAARASEEVAGEAGPEAPAGMNGEGVPGEPVQMPGANGQGMDPEMMAQLLAGAK